MAYFGDNLLAAKYDSLLLGVFSFSFVTSIIVAGAFGSGVTDFPFVYSNNTEIGISSFFCSIKNYPVIGA